MSDVQVEKQEVKVIEAINAKDEKNLKSEEKHRAAKSLHHHAQDALDKKLDDLYNLFFHDVPRVERKFQKKLQRNAIFSEIRAFSRKSNLLYFLLISAAIILYWRGLWQLYDIVFESLFPRHDITSAFISIFLGLIILVGTRQSFKKIF